MKGLLNVCVNIVNSVILFIAINFKNTMHYPVFLRKAFVECYYCEKLLSKKKKKVKRKKRFVSLSDKFWEVHTLVTHF